MKTAIVFYSLSGNSRYVAEKMATLLNADLISIAPAKAYPNSGFKKFFWGGKSALMGDKPQLESYTFDPTAYDSIILGGPVWAGTFPPPLRTFVEDNRAALQDKRLAAFFCCSGGPGKVLEKFRAFLVPGCSQQEIILIDPKDKPSSENENKIVAFCDAMR